MQGKKILIVEDNPLDEILTIRALKQSRVANEIEVVRDGSEAIDYLHAKGKFAERRNLDLPALVILDLHLPVINGLEVLRRIRADERTKLLPVVILTASDRERDRIDGYKLGVNSFVKKPMQYSDFIMAVVQLGRYWLVVSEPPPKDDLCDSDSK